jgi:hypothetical protein
MSHARTGRRVDVLLEVAINLGRARVQVLMSEANRVSTLVVRVRVRVRVRV